ncbi:IS66 family transposase [Ideonella azotifigens]|uniref:IS66-like element ISH10B family transposase n=1 Tax=Ideonella azotifigens TaxID=513160 RepID=A0ABP3V425_9BURK|nr:IS66 family transposase [Ideonella azotifigens]MCD2341023.1 IS66 family transposase [Ideonella azotifigens]
MAITPSTPSEVEGVKPATLAQCHEIIAQQALELAELRQAVALLAERLKLDSHNSSKPPSSDGPGGANRAQRRASGRKRGAQKGHPGTYRALLPETEVNGLHQCVPPPQCECGEAVAVRGKPYRHQVFDIPPAVADVQEYQLYSGVCSGCGKLHRAPLPAGVPSGQIGPRALAIIGTLGTRHHLTQFKIRDLLAQMMGLDFSVGTISQAHGKVAQALKAPVHEAIGSLAKAPLVHMDETRYPREGQTNWVWAAVHPTLAVFNILPSRARYVIHELIGREPGGIVVSDRYAGYAFIDPQRRQVCWAHLLRDFNRIGQRQGLARQIGRRLLGLGFVLFRWRERGKAGAQFEALQRRVHTALTRGVEQTGCPRTQATCQNLLKLWPALWGFVGNPAVPPTNNEAERSIRSIVLKRKISGPTRSKRGDEFIARGFSVVETCRRQGRDLLAYMHQAVIAWIDKAPHPSLLPPPPQIAPSG